MYIYICLGKMNAFVFVYFYTSIGPTGCRTNEPLDQRAVGLNRLLDQRVSDQRVVGPVGPTGTPDQWVVEPTGRRTNGPSDQRAVGPTGRRIYELPKYNPPDQWAVRPKGH